MARETPAVVAGLSAGIAVIVLFAAFISPVRTMSNERIIEKAKSLPEVQAFYDRAGNSPVSESVRHSANSILVTFAVSRMWGYGDPDSQAVSLLIKKTLRVNE